MKRPLVLALLLLGTTGSAAAEARDYDAEIRRTSGGVPHIKASDYGDLGFGYGYAYAQDNLCTLADVIVTVNAQRARYFGPDAAYGETGNVNNLKSDFFFQRLKDMKTVEKLVKKKPPQGPLPNVRATIRGFAAGYNAYLRRTGVDKLPDKRCRGAKWVRPITVTDLNRHYYRLALRASSVNFLQGFVDASPPVQIDPGPKLRPSPDALHEFDGGAMGSNAYGIGSGLSANGRGVVLGNPHFPWHGNERFYMAHLTIPGELDVSGAALHGAPVVNIGTTRGVAWSHTVSTARRFTPYELKLADGDPTSYVVDGKTEKMKPRTVKVQAKGRGEVEHTFYETRWGPVFVSASNGFLWTGQNAYAMADGNADNMRILNAWAEMDRAQTVRQLKQAQDRTQGVPWVYTIAADSKGEAYFGDHSVTPNVTKAKVDACVSSDFAKAVLAAANLPVLDGSRAACRWGRDSDALGNRTFGPKNMPLLFRTDYVENSNDSHWLANPRKLLVGFPQIWGPEATARSLRTRLGLKMLEERIAANDDASRADVQGLLFNDRNFSAELGRDTLVERCRANPSQTLPDGRTVDISEACEVLAAWDGRGLLDSRGEILWREFYDRFTTALPALADRWAVQFDPADPIGTPNTFRTDQAALLGSLADAVQDMRDAGVPLNASVGERQAEPKGSDLIPIHGCRGFEGCFNVIEPFKLGEADYRDIRTGASFMMAVGFGKNGPDGQAILSYSQSENASSPHFADQTKLYSARRWLPMRFTDRAIRGDGDYSTRTVRGSD